MKSVWFEIGRVSDGEDGFSKGETYTVFRSGLLSECLKECKEQGYKPGKYFIDVWEADSEEATPFPVGEIKLSAEILANV
jgi:hypothetical protein